MIDLYTLPRWQKFTIAGTYDVLDLFSVPGLGSFYDFIGIPLGYALWGPVGLANAWELMDPTDAVDRFFPTMVIAGLAHEFGFKR